MKIILNEEQLGLINIDEDVFASRKKGKTRPNKESLGCSLVDIKVEKQHAHRSRIVKMLAPKKRLVRKRFTPQSPFAERLLFVMTGIEEFCLLFFC